MNYFFQIFTHMNILDVFIGLYLAWNLYQGFSRGFVASVASLLGLIAGLYCSLRFSDWVGSQLFSHSEIDEGMIALLSFVITFVGVLVAVYFIGKFTTRLIKTLHLGLLNKIAGALFSGLKSILIMSVLFGFFRNINHNNWIVPEEKMNESILYSTVNNLAEWVFPRLTVFYHTFLEEYLPNSEEAAN